MSYINQWLITRAAELGIPLRNLDSDADLRQQLQEELLAMTDEHENYMDLSGSMHNASFEEADWEELA